MTSELTLSEWLSSTQERRDDLDTYSRSPIPTDRSADTDKAIENAHDAGNLLADAECYLAFEKDKELLTLLEKDLTSKDREVFLKSHVRGIQKVVDKLAVTVRSINARPYILMNANRSRL